MVEECLLNATWNSHLIFAERKRLVRISRQLFPRPRNGLSMHSHPLPIRTPDPGCHLNYRRASSNVPSEKEFFISKCMPSVMVEVFCYPSAFFLLSFCYVSVIFQLSFSYLSAMLRLSFYSSPILLFFSFSIIFLFFLILLYFLLWSFSYSFTIFPLFFLTFPIIFLSLFFSTL